MLKNTKEKMETRYLILSDLIKQIDNKLKRLPSGRIKICHHGNKVYYYLAVNNDAKETKLLNKDDHKLIEDLIQKSYLEKVLRSTKQEASALEKALDHYPSITAEDIYEQLTNDRKTFVKPIISTDEQYIQNWLSIPFVPKGFGDDAPLYLTRNGERVRSKSEMIIADRLLANGIPYKYECPLKVKNGVIHPDFTILKISERRILYLEHCGKMDDPKYTEGSVVKRVNDYNRAGVSLGDNLFLTFESSATPLDVRVLDDLINKSFK